LKKIKIINFSTSGGIKQFSEYFIKECFSEENIEILNSNSFKKIYYFIKKNKDTSIFIFTNNSMKIYYCMFLGLSFRSILILHDHKIRNGASFRDKLLNFFVYKFIKKFDKVIIHDEDKELITKYPNMIYKKMPYHNGEVIQNNNKVNLLFFGRIEPYKNLDMLIESFLIGNLSEHFNLIIAGKGNISDDLLQKIEQGNVTLINQFIDDRTRDILIEWCHYFILPYNSLTQTGIVDMAGYYKKPSIVSNIKAFSNYQGKSFKNILDITDTTTIIESLEEIYKDYYINYEKAQKEAYEIYLASYAEWENYKHLFEDLK